MQRLPGGTKLAAVAFGTVMVVASLVPGSEAAAPAFGPVGIVCLDKWAHAGGFLVLTVLAARSVAGRRALLGVVIGLIVLGGGIELGQTAVPGRTFEVADLFADVVGVVAGLVVHRWLGR